MENHSTAVVTSFHWLEDNIYLSAFVHFQMAKQWLNAEWPKRESHTY